MLFHTGCSEEVAKHLTKLDTKSIITLLIASLAEIHSNAEMFGGIESTSFKIKWKNIDRRGKQVFKYLKEQYNGTSSITGSERTNS
jgi:hypothetical protein